MQLGEAEAPAELINEIEPITEDYLSVHHHEQGKLTMTTNTPAYSGSWLPAPGSFFAKELRS